MSTVGFERRAFGRTNTTVPRLGFGGIPIMNVPVREAVDIVRRALELGIEFFDTARGYRDSEEKIGQAIKSWRGPVFLATKSQARSSSAMERDVRTSLDALGVHVIDLYQLHQVDDDEDLRDVMGRGRALDELKRMRSKGYIKFIGITGHNPRVLVQAIETGEFDSVMAPVNILDRFIFNVEETVIPVARRLGIGTIAMKPLAGGVLREVPLALRYALSQDVDVVIPGMGSLREVERNVVETLTFSPLGPRELDRLVRDAKSLGRDVCRQCGYCMPCPEGIPIREVFRLRSMYDRYERKMEAVRLYLKLETDAGSCVECGECERRCPYSLPIRDKLKEARIILTQIPEK